jgi:hypothetical protein
LSKQYPELLHYTNSGGLRGILSSSSLWATDATFLNDSSEITHFFDERLRKIVLEDAHNYAMELGRTPQYLARMISDGGIDTVVGMEADAWHSTLRQVTLAMNRPFVLSFSGPSDERIRQSGLLSQWRGYGIDGGYALVFDTQKLEALLTDEAHSHHYMHVQIGDVYYHGVDEEVQAAAPDVAEYEAIIHQGVSRLLRGGTAAETERFYEAITGLSCLCKHWGFWEEREVRVVAIPASEEVARDGEPKTPPQKEVKSFDRRGQQIPYIELFDTVASTNSGVRLPIQRVIVGPHRNREAHAESVRELLANGGYDAEVVQSEIPYIGW